jgi:flagellar assembly protein FliH
LLVVEEMILLSRLIKSQNVRQKDEEKAREDSSLMIREAEDRLDQANSIINQKMKDWELEKEIIAQEAWQEGYNDGLHKGELDSKQQYSSMIEDLKEILNETRLSYHSQIEKSEETILQLAIKVAEKIMKVELEENKLSFLQIVKHAIKEAKEYSDINLIVHPSMFQLVFLQKDELQALINRETSLFIYPDEELQETGCIIESSFGRIDASIDSQLTELKMKLLELLEEG